jgi:hypothetical protein
MVFNTVLEKITTNMVFPDQADGSTFVPEKN